MDLRKASVSKTVTAMGSGLLFLLISDPELDPRPSPALPPAELEILSLHSSSADPHAPPFEPIEALDSTVADACAAIDVQARPRPSFDAVRGFARRLLDRQVAPAFVVGVSVRGQTVWAEGFGAADVAGQVPATEETMFSLASVSKPFTATAIMRAVARGEIDLGLPINEYLDEPGIRAGAGDPSRATVERVASHTAGLPVHFQLYYEDDGVEPPDAAQVRRRYAVTHTVPGSGYRYSNLGYALLEHALSETSDRSFSEVLHAEVFEPLRLHDSSVGTPRARSNVARRYGHDGRPLSDYDFDHDGASAVYASVQDLLTFGEAHLGLGDPPLLPEDLRRRMRTPVAPARGYALGWGVGRSDGLKTFGHTGGMPGVSTVLRIYPEPQVVIAVVANTAGAGGANARLLGLVVDALGLPARSSSLCALPSGHPVFGTWRGRVDDGESRPPVELRIAEDGTVDVTLGHPRQTRTLRGIGFADAVLTGWFWESVPGRSHPVIHRLSLRFHEERAVGSITSSDPATSMTAHHLALRRTTRGERSHGP